MVTGGFKEPIGEGGFGRVYKGCLPTGEVTFRTLFVTILLRINEFFSAKLYFWSFKLQTSHPLLYFVAFVACCCETVRS